MVAYVQGDKEVFPMIARVAVTASVIFFVAFPAALAAEVETLAIGSPAPDFSLPGVDGKTHTLADYVDADVLVIVFTCNHCPTAQAYEKRIQRMADDYKDRGVALVAISPNDPLALRLDELGYSDLGDSFEDMKIRAKDHHFTFPYLYDGETQEVSKQYGPMSTPHVFIFGKDRKLRYVGRVDDNENPDKVKSYDARNAIEALLAGQPVPVEKTKTVGCSTKWSSKRPTVKASFERWAKEPVDLERIGDNGIADILKNDSGKLRLINVWATWCGPCVFEFPELVEMHRMYRGRDFELITISGDPLENEERVMAFLRKNEASTRNYLYHNDDTYALVEAVDPEWEGTFPHTLLVAPGGKVIYRHTGQFDSLEVKRAIVEYLGRTYK